MLQISGENFPSLGKFPRTGGTLIYGGFAQVLTTEMIYSGGVLFFYSYDTL